jgi:hypothetical protein
MNTVKRIKEVLKRDTGFSVRIGHEKALDPNTMMRQDYTTFSCPRKKEFDFQYSRDFMANNNAHYCANQNKFYIPSKDLLE